MGSTRFWGCPNCNQIGFKEVSIASLSKELQQLITNKNIKDSVNRCVCGCVWAEQFSYGTMRGEVFVLQRGNTQCS